MDHVKLEEEIVTQQELCWSISIAAASVHMKKEEKKDINPNMGILTPVVP